RPASRVTCHAAGGKVLQIRRGIDLPASWPVKPLRDGLRFAHFPTLGRSPSSLFDRREEGELYAGGQHQHQEPGRPAMRRTEGSGHSLAITTQEFPFHPAAEQGGRETAACANNAADRRPERAGG